MLQQQDQEHEQASFGWSHCLNLSQSASSAHQRSKRLGSPPDISGGGGELSAIRRILATEASIRNDIHLVKYTRACLDMGTFDPEHVRLYLAAAAHLCAVWMAEVPRATIAEALLVDRITPRNAVLISLLGSGRSHQSAWGRQLTVVSVYALAGSMRFRGYVLAIHGGPGARFAPFDSDSYGSLAADGFRVYLYDQAGSGASVDMSRTDVGPRVTSLPPLRLLAGLLLMEKNPDAAEQLLPQREAEEMTGPFLMEVTRFGKTLVCKGDSAKIPALIAGIKDQPDNPGFNGYVSDLLLEEASTTQADPRAALRGNKTPAILLYGECNYLAWNGTVDYRKTYANLKIFYIPKAGHYIQFEQPELMKKVIRNFLLDQPDAIPTYTYDADPRLPTAK
jgi:pimeloyl-ACP methyl ester carboxylesterase